MTDQMPLYLGIPLAILCLAVTGVALALGIAMWRDRK